MNWSWLAIALCVCRGAISTSSQDGRRLLGLLSQPKSVSKPTDTLGLARFGARSADW